jgi:hypothetical protein
MSFSAGQTSGALYSNSSRSREPDLPEKGWLSPTEAAIMILQRYWFEDQEDARNED